MKTKQAVKSMCALAQGKIHVALDEKNHDPRDSKDWVDCLVALTLDAAFLIGIAVGFFAAVALWFLAK